MMTIDWNPLKDRTTAGRSMVTLAAVVAAVALLVGTLLAHAEADIANAGEGNEPQFVPFYARTGNNELIVNDDWAVVYFYYEDIATCVPDDFNLMRFFDFRAWNLCEIPATSGNLLAQHATKVGNGDVPVWLALRAAFDAEIADGVLLLSELEAISIKGSAHHFNESINPASRARQTHIVASGKGELEDGRHFNFSYASTVYGKTGGAYQVNVHVR